MAIYAVPIFYANNPSHDLRVPTCGDPALLLKLIKSYFKLPQAIPWLQNILYPPPVTLLKYQPPRRIPGNYCVNVQQQINTMLQQGINEPSSSPWMAPAVFIRKKNGEVRLCVDYRELNQCTVKDAYPIPRPDEIQDCLMGCTVFSTLDLRSGYWQLPVHHNDQPKTTFALGLGLGSSSFIEGRLAFLGYHHLFNGLSTQSVVIYLSLLHI